MITEQKAHYAPNQRTPHAAVHSANKNGKPFQLLPELSMIACTTFGPIKLEARFDSPNRPKNCRDNLPSDAAG